MSASSMLNMFSIKNSERAPNKKIRRLVPHRWPEISVAYPPLWRCRCKSRCRKESTLNTSPFFKLLVYTVKIYMEFMFFNRKYFGYWTIYQPQVVSQMSSTAFKFQRRILMQLIHPISHIDVWHPVRCFEWSVVGQLHPNCILRTSTTESSLHLQGRTKEADRAATQHEILLYVVTYSL